MKMSDFSERLKSAMQKRGITQAELSKLTGIPKSAISQYLSSRFQPKSKRHAILCETLNVSEGWLKGYDCDPSVDILSERETVIIREYRTCPEIRAMIDALIDNESYDVFRAAKSERGTVAPTREEISGERLRRLVEMPETDEDL